MRPYLRTTHRFREFKVVGTSGSQRIEHTLNEIRDRITNEDVDSCLRILRESLSATVIVRGALEKPEALPQTEEDLAKRGLRKRIWHYTEVPDHATRLAGARVLLAYRFGMPPSHQEVKVSNENSGEMTAVSSELVLEEIRAGGADLKKIVETWANAAETAASGIGPSAEQLLAEADRQAAEEWDEDPENGEDDEGEDVVDV